MRAVVFMSDKHIGLKEELGNKGCSLSNRLRAVLNAEPASLSQAPARAAA